MSVKVLYLIFMALATFIGFCAGMLIASQVLSKGNGFSEAAAAFLYGIIGAIAGLGAAVLIVRKMDRNGFKTSLIVAVILTLGIVGWIMYRITENKTVQAPAQDSQPVSSPKTTTPRP